jgi:hypothetical protein
MSLQTSTAAQEQQPIRIGARIVVELLRLRAQEPLTDKIRLTPNRNRHAVAVLNDKLVSIQKTIAHSGVYCSVSDALVERCSELEIALPIAEPDWGAIQLVDELFDQLLDQSGLDAEAQLWFSQLRLLVARSALRDYSFFFAPQNLLRRFLNQAYLNMLSSTEKSRQVHRDRLNQFAKRMLSELDADLGVVNSLCIEAQAWFASHGEQVEQIGQRLKVLESIRRKEKVAEPRVVSELNRIAAGKKLPVLVVDFLLGEWRKAMLTISMREGDDGQNWKRQLRTTESLIEFCQGCQNEQQRDRYRSFYQVLMRNLRALLHSTLEDSTAVSDALEPLELVLSAALSGTQLDSVAVPQLNKASSQIIEAQLKTVSPKAFSAIEQLQEDHWIRLKAADGNYELCKIVLKGKEDDPWVLVSQSGKTVAKKNAVQLAQALEGGVLQVVNHILFWDSEIQTKLGRLHDQWQQQRLAARPTKQSAVETDRIGLQHMDAGSQVEPVEHQSRVDEVLQHSTLELAAEDSPPADLEGDSVAENISEYLAPRAISETELKSAIDAIDKIQVGGWIEQETTEGMLRCKLAVKIRATDKLIFVNRLGIKVLAIEKQELARLLVYGAITIVDIGVEFDNTLERVVRSIQKDKI